MQGFRFSSSTPLLTPEPQTPKPPEDLIRNHTKVLVAISYQLIQLMFGCCVVTCSIYVRSFALSFVVRRFERLHRNDIDAFEKHRSSMEATMFILMMELAVGGLFVATINALLIHQCFAYGINVVSNLIGSAAVVVISIVIACGSCYVFVEVSRHPNDSAGLVEDHIFLYKHIMRVALESDDEVMRTAVMNIHEKLQCCGFHSISDYYTAEQIDYGPASLGPGEDTARNMTEMTHNHSSMKAYNAFRISNGWVHECSAKASQMLNSTYVCYAPSFCCVNASKPLLDGACPPLKWDGVGKLDPGRTMYQYPCTRRIVITYRNKMMNIMLFSLMTALVAIVCGVHLYFWQDGQKSQQSSASQMSSPAAAQPAPPTT